MVEFTVSLYADFAASIASRISRVASVSSFTEGTASLENAVAIAATTATAPATAAVTAKIGPSATVDTVAKAAVAARAILMAMVYPASAVATRPMEPANAVTALTRAGFFWTNSVKLLSTFAPSSYDFPSAGV